MNTSKRTSILLAGGVTVAVSLWMLSGLGSSPVDFSSQADADTISGTPMRVRTELVRSSAVTREIVVSARTEPNRLVRLRAETDGAVVSLPVERGNTVSAGATVIELDMRDRNARLAEATSLVTQRELELQARRNLRDRDFASEVEIAEAAARLESAKAARERIQLELDNITIEAPFNGIMQERSVEIGDYVRAGDTVAEIVDIDPLIIAGDVNGKEVSELGVGSPGTAVLVNGTELQGTIRYLSPVADENTRTFRVELAVANPDRVRAGLTAELRLSGSRLSAHDISSALLTLADDGTVGVKAVDSRNRVEFYPVEIVGASEGGILVTGLPESLRVITVGQGFVTVGQLVEPVAYSALEDNAVHERAD